MKRNIITLVVVISITLLAINLGLKQNKIDFQSQIDSLNRANDSLLSQIDDNQKLINRIDSLNEVLENEIQNTKFKSYYINTSGQSEFNKTYDALESFSEGLAVVSVNKKLGIINRKGEWVRPPNFDTSSQKFQSGFLLCIQQ
jgi:hypothetical protein